MKKKEELMSGIKKREIKAIIDDLRIDHRYA